MRLNNELLIECEEFFELINNEQEDSELGHAVADLRELLERDVDGWTNYSNSRLAEMVLSRLQEIWELIPKEEKKENPNLCDYYDSFCALLEEDEDFEGEEETYDWDEEE